MTTLPGHKAPVNCTLWLPTKKDVLQGASLLFYFVLTFLFCFVGSTFRNYNCCMYSTLELAEKTLRLIDFLFCVVSFIWSEVIYVDHVS